MPPKIKVTEGAILDAALELTRQKISMRIILIVEWKVTAFLF
jgi:hypothetical protein